MKGGMAKHHAKFGRSNCYLQETDAQCPKGWNYARID
jgi:hypothetical protein